MNNIKICQMCGGTTKIEKSDEGTQCYMPIESIYKRALQLIAAKKGRFLVGKPEYGIVYGVGSETYNLLKEECQDNTKRAFNQCADIALAALESFEIKDN